MRKVLWTVDELGIPYDRQDWGRGFEPLTSPEFLAINPFALIPAIDDDGFVLSESNTIIRYLAARHGREDLLPGDPRGRAIVERWIDWQAIELSNAWRGAFLGLVAKAPIPGGDEVIQASLQDWTKKMGLIEAQLVKTGGYIVGPSLTLADFGIGLVVHRWFASDLPIDRPDLPAIAAYYERLSQRPAFMAHGRNAGP